MKQVTIVAEEAITAEEIMTREGTIIKKILILTKDTPLEDRLLED